MIGETVNMASRLEALTKKFGTDIVMSSATYECVRDRFATIALGETEVRGFQGRLPVFGLSFENPVETKREILTEVNADAIPI